MARRRFTPFTLQYRSNLPQGHPEYSGSHAAVRLLTADDPLPIDQQLANAFNTSNAVMAYVTGLQQSNVPSLSGTQPDWWTTFESQFSDAKTNAVVWVNSIAPGLSGLPQSISQFGAAWNIEMTTIGVYLSALQADPSNQTARSALASALTNLAGQISTQQQSITGFQVNIQNFSTSLVQDAANLLAAINNAKQTAGYDKNQVDQLQADINQLQSDIAKWQNVVTGAAIGAGVSFFVGAVIGIFSFGIGLAFGIVGALAGIATLIAAEVKISQDTNQINADNAQIAAINQQITQLQTLETMLQNIETLSSQAQGQLQLILQAWETLESELGAVVLDLTNAETDLSSGTVAALAADLQSATSDWATVVAFCNVVGGIKFAEATPATAQLPNAA